MMANPALKIVRDVPAPRPPKAPSLDPVEPDWNQRFPIVAGADGTEIRRVRKVAHEVWHRWVEDLTKAGVLARVHSEVLADAATCVARIEQAERDISIKGATYVGASGGVVMNRSVTVATQYRQVLGRYVKMLGLAPGAELPTTGRLPDDDNVWDE